MSSSSSVSNISFDGPFGVCLFDGIVDDTRFELTGLVFAFAFALAPFDRDVCGVCIVRDACAAAGVLLTVKLNVTVGGWTAVVCVGTSGIGGGLAGGFTRDINFLGGAIDDFGVALS